MRALSANRHDPSTPRSLLRASTPVHTRIFQRKQAFVLGERPEVLKHVGSIDDKTWRQYKNHLDRIPAWERGEHYARQIEARRLRSQAALERLLGLPRGHVRRAMTVLTLPAPVLDYLKSHATPDIIRFFTEHQLLALARQGQPRTIWREFQRLLREAAREAGVWIPIARFVVFPRGFHAETLS